MLTHDLSLQIHGCQLFPLIDRNEMALWMYSSGPTGRPKGIVHLQYVVVYTDQSFAKHVTIFVCHLFLGTEMFFA
jgi:acyl-coenzyme A synthetase/AMP-(fatty) acid ligase